MVALSLPLWGAAIARDLAEVPGLGVDSSQQIRTRRENAFRIHIIVSDT
jgi:hypothetical protein